MKKIILLFIMGFVLILLTGCGIYNLNGFVIPDNGEFLACIEELDTPQKIGDYMLENFTYQYHSIYAPSPYQLWLTKNGDCNDMSAFSVFVANYHGYETYQVKIFYKGTIYSHCIAICVEEGGMSFTDNGYYFNNQGNWFNTFKEIVEFDSSELPDNLALKKYKVYDYQMNIIETGYNN